MLVCPYHNRMMSAAAFSRCEKRAAPILIRHPGQVSPGECCGYRARMLERDGAGTTGLNLVRARSPVHGLARHDLGQVQVLAQSVSGAAPAAAMAATPAIVAGTAGSAGVWSFLVATLLALLVGTCIGQFTRRMAAAGSLYSLTAKGLGPAGAFACGAGLLAGYGLLAMAALTGAAVYLRSLLARVGVVPAADAGGVLLAVAVPVLGALAMLLMVRGVRLSARVVLLVESTSITIMVVIFTVLLGSHGIAPDPGPFAPAGNGLGGIAAGVLPALAAFIGFESAAALGVEARRPFRMIPRAVLATAAAAGVLYLFAAYTQLVGFGGDAAALAAQAEPVNALAAAQGLPWLTLLLDAGIAMSFFACALATGNALVRVLFSMGREGVAPRVLGAAHPRHRTPHAAIALSVPALAAVPAALLGAGAAPLAVLSVLLTAATVGYLVAYLLVCVAAPLFLRRIGELTTAPVLAAGVAAPILLVVLAAFVVSAGPVFAAGCVLAAALAAAWFVVLRVRRPRRLAEIGVYDETCAADLLAADLLAASGPPPR